MAVLLLLVGCRQSREATPETGSRFTVAFGSCNRSELPNPFWDVEWDFVLTKGK